MATNETVTVTTVPRGRSSDSRGSSTVSRRSRSTNRNNNARRTDVVVVNPPKNKQDDVITSAVKATASVFEDPATLIFTLVSLAIAIDFTINPSDNFILTLAKFIGPETTIGKFLTENSLRAIGILMLVPATFNYTGKTANVKYLLALGVSIAILVFPAMTYLGYFLASLFLRVYLRTKDKTLRLIMGVALSVLVINIITKNSAVKTSYDIFPDVTPSTVAPTTATPTTTTPRPQPTAAPRQQVKVTTPRQYSG